MQTALALLVAGTLVAGLSAQNDMRGVSFNGSAYALSSTTGTGSLLGSTGANGLNAMASVGGQLVSITSSGMLVAIDPVTGASSPLVATTPALTMVRGMAASLAGVLYVIDNGGTGTTAPDELFVVDVATGTATLIGNASHSGLQGLAVDFTGTIFSWDVGSGSGIGVGLVTIDATTGASTDVDPSTGNAVDIQCLAISPTNVLYGARNALFTLDPTTGVATLVGSGGYSDLRGVEFTGAASCSTFNGNQVNPNVCACATAPVLGTNWDVTVTPSPTTVLTLAFLAAAQLPVPVPLFGGEALVAPPIVDIGATGLGTHTLALPASSALAGVSLYLQGLRLDASLTIELTNGVAGLLGF